jgi:glucuronokinase
MNIKTRSYPRAALIGNPSDGYNGRTIAFLFSNFSAEVALTESSEINIIPSKYDYLNYSSIKDLSKDVELYGYYGGIRLIKATIKVFYSYCIENNLSLDNRNFTIQYHSDIPFGLGLAGSSAIIMACMRALMKFFYIEIQKPILANLVWAVENNELKIAAGLQDRVAQAYEAPVFMDFSKEFMDKQGYGYYETFSSDLLPDLYIAYRTDLAEGSEVVHNSFRERYNYNDPTVLKAIEQWSGLTLEVKRMLFQGQKEAIGLLLNRNFDIRKNVMQLSQRNIEMVEAARAVGASAKFTGSGGAIIGTYENEEMFQRLCVKLKSMKVDVIKPKVVCNLS